MGGTGASDPEIRDWALVAPQLTFPGKDRPWDAGGHSFSVKFRSRVGVRVGDYSEPQHRQPVEVIISPEPVASANEVLEAHRQAGRGVFLFYPVTHHDGERAPHDVPTMGFALLVPTQRN